MTLFEKAKDQWDTVYAAPQDGTENYRQEVERWQKISKVGMFAVAGSVAILPAQAINAFVGTEQIGDFLDITQASLFFGGLIANLVALRAVGKAEVQKNISRVD